MRRPLRGRARRAVILILAAGILAVLSALAFSLYSYAHIQSTSAPRFSDALRAELLAQGGLHDAIARLRVCAYQRVENPNAPWFTVDYLHGAARGISFAEDRSHNKRDDNGDGKIDDPSEARMPFSRALGSSARQEGDRYALLVEDAASKINLNACDNLSVVLDNLCRLIGPPLVAAEQDLLQPRRWYQEGATDAGLSYHTNIQDTSSKRDLYFELDQGGRPVQRNTTPYRSILAALGKPVDGTAVFGDGYAIAAWRGRKGCFRSLDDLRRALTYVERDGNSTPRHPLEILEIEAKLAVLRPYVTWHSWVDLNTVCVGKFEWVGEAGISGQYLQILIDRDKSWVADDPAKDPLNLRGSLRGCYVSIINGHGAGQLRRIAANGLDWIGIRTEEELVVEPGPVSSYLIMAPEDAVLESLSGQSFPDFPKKLPPAGQIYLPKLNPDGTLVDNPLIDHFRNPLCIHRAPVNVNTASDKVLAALFMGINVQHGHHVAIGTDADLIQVKRAWYRADPNEVEDRLQTYKGLKRLPVSSGRLVFDRPAPKPPPQTGYDLAYLSGTGPSAPKGLVNEAQELAYRAIIAREADAAFPCFELATGQPRQSAGQGAAARGPFRSWDDFYFRVVRPWDKTRYDSSWEDLNRNGKKDDGEFRKAALAPMIMAQFNSNTDLLKFNPNIEWIDRWGCNFSEMEPVMVYTNQPEPHSSNPPVADPVTPASIPIYSIADPQLKSSQRDSNGQYKKGAYITRNYRYKSDELIDKSDLNRSTAELTFDSNGIFEVNIVGDVLASAGGVLAERRLENLVKVYDVWRESTQRQFAQGKISEAAGAWGVGYSGQVARDAHNVSARLALVTQPEPLVPLLYTIRDQRGAVNPRNKEEVDTSLAGGSKRNAFGGTANIHTPEAVANRILPAAYDGQILLATNTSKYDPVGDKDTFLATFDGDLDTATCAGNGHEQAKAPHIEQGVLNGVNLKGKGHFIRVVDCFGLLGVLNDTLVDMDPGLPMVDPNDPVNGWRWVYKFQAINNCLRPLKTMVGSSNLYYNNVTLRMGDLRTDGVYLSAPGVAGNDATVKYLCGVNKENFRACAPSPGEDEGNVVSMWAKTTWHHNDFRHHEFFNASNPGTHWHRARGCYIAKYGQYSFCLGDASPGAGHSANRTKINDLMCFWEANGASDWDYGGLLHGGYAYVNALTSPDESPSFRVQPFRWSFLGARRRHFLPTSDDGEGDGPRGHWAPYGSTPGYQNQKNLSVVLSRLRPFIDTQMHPEGANTWKPNQFWCFRTNGGAISTPVDTLAPGTITGDGRTGQDVKWSWCDPPGAAMQPGLKCFSINNLNFGNHYKVATPDEVYYHYRFMPDDGTYAVVDELKLSNRDRVLARNPPDWINDRVVREQGLSRYYLPPYPDYAGTRPEKGGPPTFTSQTLLQSEKGFGRTAGLEDVTLVRVTWTVFTPRFMHEYKVPTGKFTRKEKITYAGENQKTVSTAFKGPFDYDAYNNKNAEWSGKMTPDGNGRIRDHVSVNRPSPDQYPDGQSHAGKGVEIELLRDKDDYPDNGNEVVLAGPFRNPEAANEVKKANAPVKVRTGELRYRVRFRYPVDPLVDPAGGSTVNPASQCLLDTPVFDDISITYFSAPRLLFSKETVE